MWSIQTRFLFISEFSVLFELRILQVSMKNGIVTDQWAFLEHFDAPMWADLTLEPNSAYEYKITDDDDDDWFNKNHLFHQLSARELKSKFAHSVEDAVMLQGFASPGLPSSVSKSRGKHYNKMKWGKGINLNALLDKQEGLSRRGCYKQGASIGNEVKPKSTSSVSKPKSGLTFELNARGKTMSKASCGNLVGSSSSMDKKNYERSTRTMLTSENMIQKKDYKEHKKVSYEKRKSSSVRGSSFGKSVVTEASRVQDQNKYMEVSNKQSDQKSGSSSVNSISLRKSYVTQKASKMEVDVDNMKSRGCKSSSGKSSVGSCSNASYEVKFVSKEQRKKITNTKDVVTMNLADKNRSNLGDKFKTSSITAEGKGKGKGSIIGNNMNAAKSLIKHQSIRSSTKLPGKVNKTNFCTAAKETLHKGKENATRKLTVNKHCNEKVVLARGVLKSPKTRQHNQQHKDDKAGPAALTILGEVNGQHEAKNPVNPARRIYLR